MKPARLKKNYPNFLCSARHELELTQKNDCDVYFQDEGFFSRMSNPVGCWASKGLHPYLPLQRMREYEYVYAAICPKTSDLLSLIPPESSNQCMLVFLKEFYAYRGEKDTIMITDHAMWHSTEKNNKASSSAAGFSVSVQSGTQSR